MENILAGLTITGLVVVLIVQAILHYKERITLAKINKAKDVSEMEYVFTAPEEEKEGGEDLVDIEQMPDL